MSTGTTPHVRRAVAMLPLALLAGVWVHAARDPQTAPVAPASTAAPAAPAAPLSEPASVSRPTEAVALSPLVRDTVVADVGSPSDIPSAALAAYQRAASVLGTAGPGCRIAWELVAAVGRVESDHGRHAGSRLNANGVAKPAILGPRLDGSHQTARLRDSDAGLLDGDQRFDRAVGPMQFIPSTWAEVGVDADGDGRRNPQDVDDAALAAAVYLCSGGEDLSTDDGRRSAVHRYNHSDAYVDLVLRVMSAYERSASPALTFATDAVLARGFDLPPVGPLERDTTPGRDGTRDRDPQWVPDPGPAPEPRNPDGPRGPKDPRDPKGPDDPTPSPTPTPTPTPTPSPAPADPTDPTPTDPKDPTDPTPTDPKDPTDPAEPGDPAEPAEPVDPAAFCAELGHVDDPALTDDDFDQCVAAYPTAVETCSTQGLVDDPALLDDEFDLCVLALVPEAPTSPPPTEPAPTNPGGGDPTEPVEATEPPTTPAG